MLLKTTLTNFGFDMLRDIHIKILLTI